MLSANDGSITQTVASRSLCKTIYVFESATLPSGVTKTNIIPIIPKVIDAHINIFVAIFCMGLL